MENPCKEHYQLRRLHFVPSPSPSSSSSSSSLMPECGKSRLTNVDFSKLTKEGSNKKLENLCNEHCQLGTFDFVLSPSSSSSCGLTNVNFYNLKIRPLMPFSAKGGLDVLIVPGLGNLYLSEVKKLLKSGGDYMCITLEESSLLGLVFHMFCFGWKLNIHSIARETSSRDLMLGAKAKFTEIVPNTKFTETEPSRRVKLVLGELGVSCFCYEYIALDAQRDSGPFSHLFLVSIVPKRYGEAKAQEENVDES
ncbi:hypothetical protein OROHE_016489 [Orobanche hederae]